MCRSKPYPRCSYHARVRLNAALASGDPERIKEAKVNYYTSLAGIQELRGKGKTALADKYEQRRERLIAEAQRLELNKKVPLTLALDLDETSGAFIDELRNYIAEKNGLTPEEAQKKMPTPEHYSLVESGWFKNVEEFMDVFHKAEADGVYRNMKAFDGISKTLKQLVDNRDVVVRVVTARELEWNNDTRYWLRKIRIPYKNITHTEAKETVENIDVYLDDSDKQIRTLQANNKTVVAFDNLYNQNVPSNYRVKNWSQVPAVIKQIRKAKSLQK